MNEVFLKSTANMFELENDQTVTNFEVTDCTSAWSNTEQKTSS